MLTVTKHIFKNHSSHDHLSLKHNSSKTSIILKCPFFIKMDAIWLLFLESQTTQQRFPHRVIPNTQKTDWKLGHTLKIFGRNYLNFSSHVCFFSSGVTHLLTFCCKSVLPVRLERLTWRMLTMNAYRSMTAEKLT